MIKQSEVYKVGKIGKPHGISGELNMFFDDELFDDLEIEYIVLDREGILVPFYIEEYRFRSNSTMLVKLCDIETQEAAGELVGSDVYIPKSGLFDDNEITSWKAFSGWQILNQEGVTVGKITSVDNTTANTLFEVRSMADKDVLIPVSEELIMDIDTSLCTIQMMIPDGILELN